MNVTDFVHQQNKQKHKQCQSKLRIFNKNQ